MEVASDGVVSSLTSYDWFTEGRGKGNLSPEGGTHPAPKNTIIPSGHDGGVGSRQHPITDFRASPYPYPQQVSKVNSL